LKQVVYRHQREHTTVEGFKLQVSTWGFGPQNLTRSGDQKWESGTESWTDFRGAGQASQVIELLTHKHISPIL